MITFRQGAKIELTGAWGVKDLLTGGNVIEIGLNANNEDLDLGADTLAGTFTVIESDKRQTVLEADQDGLTVFAETQELAQRGATTSVGTKPGIDPALMYVG